ncbi:MAG: SDR family oxidoreductase [bacterium]|nr:SDR family oxidoreductase [bacterium]
MANRAVLITGAAHRVGKAIALYLVENEWDVGIHYRDSKEAGEQVAKEARRFGATVKTYQADLLDPEQAKQLIADFTSDFANGSDRELLLINSASTYERDCLHDFEIDLWHRHMDLNTLAPVLLTKEFTHQAKTPRCVINILDQKVTNLTPDFLSYTVSKYALFGITKMLAMELAPNCRVNGIALGLVLQSGDQTDEEFQKEFTNTPLKKGPALAEICKVVTLIAETGSMTGQILTLDGGRHMVRPVPPYDDFLEK